MGPNLFRSWLALGLVLGASWGILGCSWAVWGRLGRVLGASRDVLGASWGVLGASWGVLGMLHGKTFEKPSILPPKIEPRTLENQAPTAARAWFERISDFQDQPTIWSDLGANLAPFWLHFPSPGASWGPLGASWRRPGGVLGASWGRLGSLGASWERLGGVLGRLGSILGASWDVLRIAVETHPKKYRFYLRKVNPETLKIIDLSLFFQCFFDFRCFQHKC